MREMRNVHKILAKKLKRKGFWNNSREITCDHVEYIQLAQDRVKTVTKFWVP
jgi:hypothetical protein